ncbi:hypothetical protein BDN70DRAFT_874469 [Pholiota conissans]|uniref:Uncharacterized protein n=1 Tax=Pholiota conissans TaxID=109636 RepID=A0A9P5Z945_9AGAR|nr:hypothetical protein BDN70DRAFT_874469 [Pholiota conissans]
MPRGTLDRISECGRHEDTASSREGRKRKKKTVEYASPRRNAHKEVARRTNAAEALGYMAHVHVLV